VVLRTDEVRKRLAGIAPTEPLPRGAYTAEAQARAYAAMFEAAGELLRAGQAVVLDATFLEPGLRARAAALAAECGVPFRPAWLDAPLALLEARVMARTGDASDATVAVLRDQAARAAGAIGWPRVDAAAPVAEAAAAWLAANP
jgi:predicted kinase